MSACAWAIGQVERGKPTLTGFRGDAEAFTEELRKRTGVGKLLADSIRNAAPDAVAGGVTAAVTAVLAPTGPLAPAVGAMAGSMAGRLSSALNRGNAGNALAQYLTANPGVPRTDVQLNPLVVRDLCSPDRVPLGRWVTSTERPLAFSQQFAVNQIIDTQGDSAGLFAVNGPPGTGKTTMLRDVIAAVIVRRAMALASLNSPRQVFTTVRESWPTATYEHAITAPSPAITGFELVVASSNNGAVENITEIPGPKGIDDQWLAAAASVDYFSATAGPGNWAMVAARLGRRENRNAFVQDFWFSGEASMRAALKAAPPAEDWRGAVAAFRTALNRVNALSSERTVVARAITRLSAAQREYTVAQAAREAAREDLAHLQARLPDIDRRSANARRDWELARESMHAHGQGKPGWLAFLSARGRQARRTWDAQHAELSGRFTAADGNESRHNAPSTNSMPA